MTNEVFREPPTGLEYFMNMLLSCFRKRMFGGSLQTRVALARSSVAKIRLGLLKSGFRGFGGACVGKQSTCGRMCEFGVVSVSVSHFKDCLDNELGANLK